MAIYSVVKFRPMKHIKKLPKNNNENKTKNASVYDYLVFHEMLPEYRYETTKRLLRR